MRRVQKIPKLPLWRQHLIFSVLLSVFVLLGWRVVHLQTVEHAHLQSQGDARYLREVTVMPERGRILDRNGQVLTVSTPVGSLWAEPVVFCAASTKWKPMLTLLDVTEKQLQASCQKYEKSDFMYIKRRVSPMLAEQVMQLEIAGIDVQQEYKRYYPGGPAGAHLVGFTNVDEVGQEGLERAFDERLRGRPGRIRVLKDRAGNYVETVESIQQVRHGEELVISIDQRIQSLASDYLEAAVRKHKATSGSVVVVSIPSGEILAMINSPQFNPNDRSSMRGGAVRNRSITDILEPGSAIKPFTVAMALESGKIGVDTIVDTSPGTLRIGSHTIEDVHNYGEITIADTVIRSSNVGVAKLALSFPYKRLFDTFTRIGFGKRALNLPGESAGALEPRTQQIEHAALSYGYGFSITSLQLARAYTVFATDGVLLPLTLKRKKPGYRAKGTRVFSRKTVQAIRPMLEQVATPEGTARQARIPHYRVGGKTGTTHKLIDGNYNNQRYLSVFAGIAPITAPRFVVVVTVDDPRGQFYYGGDVAAPVFANLMKDLVRLYNIEPDAVSHADTETIEGET